MAGATLNRLREMMELPVNSPSPLISTSPEIVEFIKRIQEKHNAYMTARFSNLPKEQFICERGTKFLAIDRIGSQRCIHVFVAACDGETKFLGKYKRGDVMKAATYKAPARHARGNIFNADGGMSAMSDYGAHYLR